jgi:phosphoribosylformimino-5-aminoimidazole carboxamide ribotide isomerase
MLAHVLNFSFNENKFDELMRIYFVMDLMQKKIVRAIGGERSDYKSIHLSSVVLKRDDPFYALDVIKPRYLYIADLDRIAGKRDSMEVIESILEKRKVKHLIADCGFKELSEIENLKFDAVLGSETFNLKKLEAEKKVKFVSLDIKDVLLDASKSFKEWKEALTWLNSFDLNVIILSLSRVGTLAFDCGLFERAAELSSNPLFAGGGIRDVNDILRLKDIGYNGVLVATALHMGKIEPELIRRGKL